MSNRHFKTVLNVPSAEQLALPFYNMLPKDAIGLLQWRIYVRERALRDLDFRNSIVAMCKQDVCFFAATVCYLHETRSLAGQHLGKFPFLPDCDQADLLAMFAKYAGSVDITCSKTRGIGLSYIICIVVLWLWLFHGEQLEFALVTKDESSLDLKDRPSSLMGKLDLLFANLPTWMKIDSNGASILDRTTTKHKFQNTQNKNTVGGYVSTDDKLRSGRFYMVILDEAAFLPADIQRWCAAAQGTSFSIIWISTFDGTSNMFYRITVDEDPIKNVVRIETWWDANPRWAAGMYVSKRGLIEILDKKYKFPSDYVFSHDDPGIPRSPMVDAAFNRPGADKQKVKEEIYGVAVKDSRRLMSKATCDRIRNSVRPCVWRGDCTSGEWVEDEDGPIQLWVLPHSLTGVYVVGADPSLGSLTGARAGLAAIDIRTGLFVLSARFQDLDGIAFAQKSVEICKMLAGPRGSGYARLIWESTGIGTAYTGEIARLRYPAVWSEPGKTTPGCHNSDRGEAWLLELGRAAASNDGIIVSEDCFVELKAFEYDRKYDLIFASSDGHGDLAIATALAWRGACYKRRAVVQTAKSAANRHENELKKYELDRQREPWSAQFDNPRKTRGRPWQ